MLITKLYKLKKYVDEEFKQVKDFEDYYISNYGNLYKYSNGSFKEINQYIDKTGYLITTLYRRDENDKIIQKCFRIHRLVAEAFLENSDPSIYTDVNHKDEDKLNNRLDNLEFCTHQYNCAYGTRGERIAQKSYRPVVKLDQDGYIIEEFKCVREAVEKYHFNFSNFVQILQGKRRNTYDEYIWRYKYKPIKTYKKNPNLK